MRESEELGHEHTEDLNSLLYAYNVCCKSMNIDGHETLKAFCFLNTTLNETLTSNIQI
jgi:hypothetical protein